jgi:N4-gp56 family major capsid protein
MATNVYGTGANSTAGANTIVHYYDRAGVEAATEMNVYGQFADRKSMPTKYGKTYKISKWLHIYDRDLTDGEFATLGYLTSRDIADVTAGLTATDGSGAALAEGAGATNKRTIKKVTMETSFASYGEMIDYTDEVELFSEDYIQVQYRKELGHLANRRYEDLIQLDMLGTTNVMYAGTATSNATMGAGIAADGSEDDLFRVDFDLIRKASRKLVRNRAKKNTQIVTGSTKVDTRTINKAFYAIIGPEVKYDLETVTDPVGDLAYVPAYKYASATNLAEGEVGALQDVRFIESESQVVYRGAGAAIPAGYEGTLSNNGTNFDLFPILFPTEGSFATVGLKGRGKIKFMSQSPDKVELSNPYGTQGFFSYRFWYAGIILQEEKLLKVMVCAGE